MKTQRVGFTVENWSQFLLNDDRLLLKGRWPYQWSQTPILYLKTKNKNPPLAGRFWRAEEEFPVLTFHTTPFWKSWKKDTGYVPWDRNFSLLFSLFFCTFEKTRWFSGWLAAEIFQGSFLAWQLPLIRQNVIRIRGVMVSMQALQACVPGSIPGGCSFLYNFLTSFLSADLWISMLFSDWDKNANPICLPIASFSKCLVSYLVIKPSLLIWFTFLTLHWVILFRHRQPNFSFSWVPICVEDWWF